jgi:hypothetical protein
MQITTTTTVGQPVRLPMLVAIAALCSGAAGLIHAVAAGSHAADTTLVWLFTAAALAQVGWAGFIAVNPTSIGLVAGAVMNLALVGVWVLTRTTGLAMVDALAEPEVVGRQDLSAALLAGASAVCALAALRTSSRPARPGVLGALAGVAMVPMLIGMLQPSAHTHGGHVAGETAAGDHAHAAGAVDPHAAAEDSHAAGADHAHEVAPAPTDPVLAALVADPVFNGGDTSGLTVEQLTAAKELIVSTRSAIATGFTDEASVTAAGYRSIGDGRRAGVTYEHFINLAYIVDDHTLDPTRIESLVFEVTNGSKRLATAMYILGPGSTMADVPEIAGDLTAWHDHQNLCWDGAGRLAGILVDGKCRPGGKLRATPPMIHVWLDDNVCGPFAGVENHGAAEAGSCAHSH